MKIALVTLHYKNLKDTRELLESLSKAIIPKDCQVKLFVVDNSNDPDLKTILDKSKFQNDLIVNNDNTGFAGGNNLGFKEALKQSYEVIGTINNDTLVDKYFFPSLCNSPICQSDVGLVGGLIYFAPGYEFKSHYPKNQLGKIIWYAGGIFDSHNVLGSHNLVDTPDNGGLIKPFETDFITGCLLFARSEVLKKVGLFDERYFLYLEDVDLSYRVKKLGLKTIVDPNIKIWHKVAQGSAIGSAHNDYYISRNRIYFGFKNLKLRTKLALIKEGIRNLFVGSNSKKTAFLDFLLFRMGKGSYQN